MRSLRVAEQFALSRAGAVVTHSQAMWTEALHRGVAPDNLFLVPDPVEAAAFPTTGEKNRNAAVTLFAPDAAGSAPMRVATMAAFALLLSELEGARLLLEVAPESSHGRSRCRDCRYPCR
jgi:hypothetical protein